MPVKLCRPDMNLVTGKGRSSVPFEALEDQGRVGSLPIVDGHRNTRLFCWGKGVQITDGYDNGTAAAAAPQKTQME